MRPYVTMGSVFLALAAGCSDDIVVTQTTRGSNCPEEIPNTSSSGTSGEAIGLTALHPADISDAVGSGAAMSDCTAPSDRRVGAPYEPDAGPGGGTSASSGGGGNGGGGAGGSSSTSSSTGGSSNGGTGGSEGSGGGSAGGAG